MHTLVNLLSIAMLALTLTGSNVKLTWAAESTQSKEGAGSPKLLTLSAVDIGLEARGTAKYVVLGTYLIGEKRSIAALVTNSNREPMYFFSDSVLSSGDTSPAKLDLKECFDGCYKYDFLQMLVCRLDCCFFDMADGAAVSAIRDEKTAITVLDALPQSEGSTSGQPMTLFTREVRSGGKPEVIGIALDKSGRTVWAGATLKSALFDVISAPDRAEDVKAWEQCCAACESTGSSGSAIVDWASTASCKLDCLSTLFLLVDSKSSENVSPTPLRSRERVRPNQ